MAQDGWGAGQKWGNMQYRGKFCSWCLLALATMQWTYGEGTTGTSEPSAESVGAYHVLTTGDGAGGPQLWPEGTAGGAFRFYTHDKRWGLPTRKWVAAPWFPQTHGLAMTLWQDDLPVFSNHGIEQADTGSYFQAGDSGLTFTPGLSSFFSMTEKRGMICAGRFHTDVPVVFNSVSGYFACVSSFDPSDPRVLFHMNIWSAGVSPDDPDLLIPATPGFTGDVFASDKTPGRFVHSDTGIDRQWARLTDGESDVWRLTYTLEQPITLPAGDYFFSHDAEVRSLLPPLSMAALAGLGLLAAGGEDRAGIGGPWVLPRTDRDGDGGKVQIVPEPMSFTLVAGGGAVVFGIRVYRRRRARRS